MSIGRRVAAAYGAWRAPVPGHVPSAPDSRAAEGPFSLPAHLPAEPPADLVIKGAHTYGDPEVLWYWGDAARCRVGDYTSIAAGVRVFVGGGHRTDWISTFPFREAFGLPGRYEGDPDGLPTSRGDVVIGSDVWLGAGATVLSGVSIGHGAVVGAQAVVTADVEPYAIVAGNPARLVRYRFPEHERAAFLRVSWWDWSEEKILDNLSLLQSRHASVFLGEYDDAYRQLRATSKSTRAEGTV